VTRHKFSFALKRSPGIPACLPHACGRVTIARGDLNDKMHISLHGMPRRTSISVSPGGTTTFGPTHQYHIGPWFNNPKVPGGRLARPRIRIPGGRQVSLAGSRRPAAGGWLLPVRRARPAPRRG
jgi:hypothetical protein